MIGNKITFARRSWLELALMLMGFGGIGLTVIVALVLAGTSLFMPDAGWGILYGFVIGVVGLTAGVLLIAFSYILSYLRIIAAGSGIERTFE